MAYEALSKVDGSQEVRLRWHPDLEEQVEVHATSVDQQTRTYPVAAIDTGTTNRWTLHYIIDRASDGGVDRWAQLEALCDLRQVIKLVNRFGQTYYGKVYVIERSPKPAHRADVTVEFQRVDTA